MHIIMCFNYRNVCIAARIVVTTEYSVYYCCRISKYMRRCYDNIILRIRNNIVYTHALAFRFHYRFVRTRYYNLVHAYNIHT